MFVIKIVIALSIVCICALLGMRKSKIYETREYMLREIITVFSGLENEMEYMLSSIPDALERIRQNLNTNLKYVFGAISIDMICLNYSSEELNKKIHENIYAVSELKPYDKQLLYAGLSNLGKGDIATQKGIISGTITSLESQLEVAMQDKKNNAKMYRTLGAAIGLVIAIVFI